MGLEFIGWILFLLGCVPPGIWIWNGRVHRIWNSFRYVVCSIPTPHYFRSLE